MLFEVVGPGSITFISDAMAATGLPDGDYTLGGLPVTVADGAARLAGSGAIAGSVAHLADCLRWAVQVAGIDLADAVRSATATPAHTYGLDAGVLAIGAIADVLVLDADLRPALVTLGRAEDRVRVAARH
jgi:N-acetylglucosamine-6-phosphate deacetylase